MEVYELSDAKQRFSRMAMSIFVILVLSSVVQLAVIVPITIFAPILLQISWVFWLCTFVPIYVVAIPIGLLMLRRIPACPPEKSRLGFGRFLKILLISVFLMYAGNLMGTYINAILSSIPGLDSVNPIEAYAYDDSLVFKLLVLVILGPFIEEFVFRKILIDRMHPYGEKLAVVCSALMFGLFHGNLSQFFYAFFLGLVFGYIYVRTGSLRHSVFLHMIINLMGGIIGPSLLSRIDLDVLNSLDALDPAALDAALTPELVGFILYTFGVIALAVVGLILFCVNAKKIHFNTAELELPKEHRFRTAFVTWGMLLLMLGFIAIEALTFIP